MTQKILVATDGSDTARKAVDMAADMAAAFDAKLTVLHVLMHGREAEEMDRLAEAEHLVRHTAEKTMPKLDDMPGSMTDLFRLTQSTDETARVVSALGDRLAQDAADRAESRGAKNVSVRVLPGDYAETILDSAKDIGADMIVMGSRGLGGLKGLLLGSVSHKVNQHADCTVVTVR
ncbi:universal stress protein [Rhodovulum sp. YNF3179]|uniref:universal stress protein n=1 Tax=Rhodovulum sp. YNF3179 TaxID=3425127 RepID=UPI003D34F33B